MADNDDCYRIVQTIPVLSGAVGPSAPTAPALGTAVPTPSGTSAPPALAAPSDPFVTRVQRSGEKLLQRGALTLEEWSAEADNVISSFEREVQAGGAADPARGHAALDALRVVLEGMIEKGDPAHTAAWVDRACLTWWDAMSAHQAVTRAASSQCYRAMAGYVLARNRMRLGDRGGAIRWAALAHLADRIDGHPGRGGADLVLRNGLGVGANVVAALDAAADDALSKANGDWADPRVFPEFCLAAAVDSENGDALVAPTTINTHHLSRPLMKRALKWGLDEPNDPNSKGERLEVISRFLAGTLPGARGERGFNALGFACEHDVVVRVEQGHSLPGGSTSMLVECKNCVYPISASAVGYFLARMKFTGVGLGVIVAKSGITDTGGDDAEKNARGFLLGFCQRENVVCLVVTRKDLEKLVDGSSFDAMLRAKHTEFAFGRKRSFA